RHWRSAVCSSDLLYRPNYGRDVVLNTQAGKIQVRRVVVPDDPHDLVYDIEFVLANGQEVEIQMNGPGTKVLCPCCSVRNGYAAFIVQVDIRSEERRVGKECRSRCSRDR